VVYAALTVPGIVGGFLAWVVRQLLVKLRTRSPVHH